MASSLCLEYQARARGKSTDTRSWTNRRGIFNAWKIQYKPCLDCEQGKEIANGGGSNDDVETLKQNNVMVGNEQTKYCIRCENHLPRSAFNLNTSKKGGLQTYCRQCQRTCQNESIARKRAAKSIDQIAPNIAPKVDNEAIKTQSITENINKIKHKDIASPMLNNDQKINITNVVPAPNSDDTGAIIAWTDQICVCRKCGMHYDANLWAALEYVDDRSRVCADKNCRGIVSLLVVDGIPPGAEIETRTCTRCGYTGVEDDFHIAGSSGRINTCRKCVAKVRTINQKARAQNTVVIGPHSVVLDFTDFPDFLETLTAEARRNFRTLANEILFRVGIMPTETESPCRHYAPWKRRSPLLNMAECWYFIPQSDRCDCSESTYYNGTCPWKGYPGGELNGSE